MIYEDMEQGGAEWLEIRCGKTTGSRVSDAIKKLKDGKTYSASRIDYAYDLAIERLTGEPQGPDLTNVKWVQDGKAWEDEARTMYEFMTGSTVKQVGFASHDFIPMFGASPDGLVGDDGCLEIKAPKAKTHISYLLGKIPPLEYFDQMDSELSCTGRQWVDFVSYNPKFPPDLRYFCVRYFRNNERINLLELEVMRFEDEVSRILQTIKSSMNSQV